LQLLTSQKTWARRGPGWLLLNIKRGKKRGLEGFEFVNMPGLFKKNVAV
jgi:hypothetical protein